MVSMPKATIHENTSPVFSQHKVWMTGQPFVVQTVSKSSTPQSTTHNHLRLCILRPYSSHAFTPLFCREFIHILDLSEETFKSPVFGKTKEIGSWQQK